MTTVTNVLAENIRVLFEKLINTEIGERNDWREILTLCALTLPVDAKAKLEFNTDNRGVKSDQFAVMHCAKHCPNENVGTKDYKKHRKAGIDRFNRGTQRALDSMNLERGFVKPPRKRNATVAEVIPPVAPKPKVGSIPVIGIAAKLREIAERIAMAQKAAVAFQTIPKVPKAGVETIGALSLDLMALATAVEEVEAMLESGTVPDKPESAIQDALNKMLAVQNGVATAPASTTPQ